MREMKALKVYCINSCRGCEAQPLFGKLKVTRFLVSYIIVCSGIDDASASCTQLVCSYRISELSVCSFFNT